MKIGRNDPCPCGSGKKYKHCCINGGNTFNIVDSTPSLDLENTDDKPYHVGYTSKGEVGWFVSGESREQQFEIIRDFIIQHYHFNYHIVIMDGYNHNYLYIQECVGEIMNDIIEVMRLSVQYGYNSDDDFNYGSKVMIDSEQELFFISYDSTYEYDRVYSYTNHALIETDMDVPNISYTVLYGEAIMEDMKIGLICNNEDVLALRNHKFSAETEFPADGDINKAMAALMAYAKELESIYNIPGVYTRGLTEHIKPVVDSYNNGTMDEVGTMWLQKELKHTYQSMVNNAKGGIKSGYHSKNNPWYGADECMKGLPILALPNASRLSLFFEDIIADFPMDPNLVATMPFNDFVIKVEDDFGKVLHVVVRKNAKGYNLIGITNTDDAGNISGDLGFMPLLPNMEIARLMQDKVMNTEDDIQDNYCAPVLHIKPDYFNENWYAHWFTTAEMYVDDDYDKATFKDNILPSSITLLIHVWMYALAMYNVLLSVRKVKYINKHAKTEQSIRPSDIKNLSNKSIIDLGKEKRIYTYETDEEREAIFRQYHVLGTTRRGFFKTCPKSKKRIYIPPTTVTYPKDKLAPDAHERNVSNIYRNSADFYREKSYLETDISKMLRQHGINFTPEAMFPWMGLKRLDFYLPDRQLAIECQGVQHFYRYGGKDTELELRQQRDEDKYNECAANGIKVLYYVSPLIPIPEEIKQKHYYITDLDELYQMIQKG